MCGCLFFLRAKRNPMPQRLGLVSLVVLNYDDAIAFYVKKLGFKLVEDQILPAQQKRWVVVAPPGGNAAHLLLAQASTDAQVSRVGDQTGGRVAFFLYTDDFWRDFNAYKERGVIFIREPTVESYGTVAVFADLYGNLWDLIQSTTVAASRDASSIRDPPQQNTESP
jgi:catechol 2,3-dioxygenase-like lactoylglutathione lyase family enzyme